MIKWIVLPGLLVFPDLIDPGSEGVQVLLQQWFLIIPPTDLVGSVRAVVVVEGLGGWVLLVLLVVQQGIDLAMGSLHPAQ